MVKTRGDRAQTEWYVKVTDSRERSLLLRLTTYLFWYVGSIVLVNR